MSEAGTDLSSMHRNGGVGGGRGEGSQRSKYQDGGSTMGLTMGGRDDDGKQSDGGGADASRGGAAGGAGGAADGARDNDEIVSRSLRWTEVVRSASPMAAASNHAAGEPAAGNPFGGSLIANASEGEFSRSYSFDSLKIEPLPIQYRPRRKP